MRDNQKTLDALKEQSQFMLECEARFWMVQVKEKGFAWWNARKDAMRKKRGDAAVIRLTEEMKRQWKIRKS